MNFKPHYELKNKHAFLSPSQYAWIRYDDDKLVSTFKNFLAKERGTKLHALAATLINFGIKLPRKQITLNMYVNDAIGYGMATEQPLYYSDNCFGTADSIRFSNNLLRIHDYKSGETPASMDQLLIYSALFCLEYEVKPTDIQTELRIYQSNDVTICNPTAEDIMIVEDKIIRFDRIISQLKAEEE